MASSLSARVIATLLLLACVALSQSKNLGVKPNEVSNDDIEKALFALRSSSDDSVTDSDEDATETDPTLALLGQSEDDLNAQDVIDEELKDLEATLDKLALSPHHEHHRSKRTIGFLTRLGSCLMTFMSNPTCWSRLTRAQMRREERRQKELEMERMKTEQEMYNNAVLKAVNGSEGSSNSTIMITLPPRPAFMTTSSPRPMMRMFQNVRSSLGMLFPRLFGSLRQPGESGDRPRFMFSGNDV